MTEAIRFDLLAESGSLERARDPSGKSYLVAFEDSNDVHEVDLHRRPNGWHGDCWMLDDSGDRTGRCRGWAFHDGPCGHLWAVRSKVAHERLTDDDQRHSADVDPGNEILEDDDAGESVHLARHITGAELVGRDIDTCGGAVATEEHCCTRPKPRSANFAKASAGIAF